MTDNWKAQVNSQMDRAGNTQAQRWAVTNCCWWMTITRCLLRSASLNFCCSYYTDCVWPLKQANAYSSFTVYTVLTVVGKTTQFTQCNGQHNTTGWNRLWYVVTACHSRLQTSIHTILMTAAVCEYYWESQTGEFWTTLKLHCAMRISGITVVSSIKIPEAVSLLSLQFQVSHNTIAITWIFFRVRNHNKEKHLFSNVV